MAYEAKKYLYLALFRECLSTLAYIVGEIDNRQISLNLGPLFSPLDFPNMRDNTIDCLPPFLRWFELRAQRRMKNNVFSWYEPSSSLYKLMDHGQVKQALSFRLLIGTMGTIVTVLWELTEITSEKHLAQNKSSRNSGRISASS